MQKINNYASFIPTIKSLVPIKTAAEHYGIEFNRADFAACPFHADRTPSFYIKNGFAYCFGCGWHGDVIDLVKDLQGLDFGGTIERINADFALNLPIGRRPTLREQRDLQRQALEIRWRQLQKRDEDLIRSGYDYVDERLWAERFELEDAITRLAPTNPLEGDLDQSFLLALDALADNMKRMDSFYQYSLSDLIDAHRRKCGETTGSTNGDGKTYRRSNMLDGQADPDKQRYLVV